MRTIRIPSFKRYLIASHFAYEFDLKSRRIVARNKSNLLLVPRIHAKENAFVKGYEKRGEKGDFENYYVKFLKKIDCPRFVFILLIEQNEACPATRGAKSPEYCPLSLRNKSRYEYYTFPVSRLR